MMKIPPLKVTFSAEDRKDILGRIDERLARGQVAQGKNLAEFEQTFAKYNRSKFAIGVSNGGTAIELAMRALNVQGKDVLVPTNTFLATAAGVHLAGGRVVLVDSAQYQPFPGIAELKAAITPNTAGVILVHIGGIVTPEIQDIVSWCNANGLWVFEDCAHAHGSEFGGKRAGTFGIAGSFSFFSTKVITSGEGGMVVTEDENVAERVMLLRSYGKREAWVTFSELMAGNARLNELAAAIGVVHLNRLDDFINARSTIADIYVAGLKRFTEIRIVQPAGRTSWYKFIALLPKGVDREQFKDRAKQRGVSFSGAVYDLPLHAQPPLRQANQFPNADDFCARHICLPLYSGMTEEEAHYVTETVRQCL